MRLDIYFYDLWEGITRDTVVYTPYSIDEEGGAFYSLGWQYAPECYTTEEECLNHFWNDGIGEFVCLKETVGDYVDRMMKTSDMNPFFTVGKYQTMKDNPHLRKDLDANH